MVPPSEVKITIPEHGISRSVDLHANFGVDAKSCADNPVGQTHYIAFEVLINGEQVSRGGIRVHGPNVLHQNWIDIVDKDGSLFQLVTGDTLVLRTSVTSKPEVDWQAAPFALPKVGFGRLQLRGQVEAPIEIASEGHPNILFVLMDTLRADRTSLGGNPVLTTPNLDRLAAGGTSYSQARATSSWTWPSTASVLTGRLPAGHGVQDMGSSYLNGEVDTLAEIM